MLNERKILHSDANSFFASVEIALNPELNGKAVAVCGVVEDRHGIVLAKSELAKRMGVKTGMVVWEAKKLCPDLVVLPPQYDKYELFSNYLKDIYRRYTEYIEPFGLDECWLDVTECHDDAKEIAEQIRTTVKEELGITVSVGVSFNKVYAKLGSDLKKPDAVTVISKDNYKMKVYPLACSELLYCGRATTKKFAKYGINTIGDIVNAGVEFCDKLLGKNGVMLWNFASGKDSSRVSPDHYHAEYKSVGHGITCTSDLLNDGEVWKVILEMSQDLGRRLKKYGLKAKGVQLTVKDNKLEIYQMQGKLITPSQASYVIAKRSFEIFKELYKWGELVRAVTVTAIDLERENSPYQEIMFEDYAKIEKIEKVDKAIVEIRSRFGKDAIKNATLCGENKMPNTSLERQTVMPNYIYK